ncbi:hypothetical protein L6452_32256 [Arctium lappa]|uniref:Uncharacterized protein n=1 Tax=Arctium lappa TaxID=4217 RepID=A0ACB8Z8C0_ARCLA|nr:hypothetical protein L6452_32256 [Arctium lappa]
MDRDLRRRWLGSGIDGERRWRRIWGGSTGVGREAIEIWSKPDEMDASNWGPTPGGNAGGDDSSIESGDWRSKLQADSREMILNNIVGTLKRLVPFSGHEGLQELKKIAMRFEEKIYTAATSQSDYLQKISLKMLTMETGSQNPMPDARQSNSAANCVNPSDPGLPEFAGYRVIPWVDALASLTHVFPPGVLTDSRFPRSRRVPGPSPGLGRRLSRIWAPGL